MTRTDIINEIKRIEKKWFKTSADMQKKQSLENALFVKLLLRK